MNNQDQIVKKFVSNDNKVASTIGNSWIICKSKSYPGRVYYFNTISGEAAWNLSVAEMEKAKKTTLESEHKIKHTEFPEPLETPHDYVCSLKSNINKRIVQHSPTPSRIYNKQIINNKFSRPSNPNPNSYTFNPFNAINPLNFNLPAFAPIMNVPTSSIILGPPISTLQPNADNTFNPMLNNQTFINTPMTMPNSFSNSPSNISTRTPFQLNTMNNREMFQNNNTSKKTVDLRQKLLNIRNKNQNDACSREDINRPEEMGSFTVFRSNAQDVNAISSDEIQLNVTNNIKETDNDVIEELLQDFDAEALKKEFGITSSKYWFLIADEDVYLSYRNFIEKLLESDNQCRLVIPQVVIVQIQKSTTSINNKESLQAASFISEKLESNLAIIDEDDTHGSDDHYENIFNCCLKLVNQDYDVLFISVKEMPDNDCGFPMFTINDIKKILMNAKLKDGLGITITISNEFDEDNALNNSILNKLLDCSIDEKIDRNYTGIQFPFSTKDTSVQTEDLFKKTDVGIQVDCFVPDKNINQSSKNIRLRRRPISASNITNKTVIPDSMNKAPKFKVQDAATNTEIETDRNVIFQILNKTMEDYLRVKLDEWVSRFVQIMEEAMTQVLQQDSSFVLDMPPPWTIYEASECIKRKFAYDSDVLDAATKLSDVLFEQGGLRGKINKNMDPDSYMKMYSYGYYLIDALQSLILNNEDLQIAGNSLTKLLSDIQNPHLDPSNSDSFTDVDSSRHIEAYTNKFLRSDQPKPSQLNNVVVISDSMSEDTNVARTNGFDPIPNNASQEIEANTSATKPTKNICEKNKSVNKILEESPTKKKYNLRNKIQPQANEQDSNEIILKHLSAKDSFLTNFELKSNNTDTKNVDDSEILNATKGHTFDTKQSEGPKIMRNFTVCPEFEQRLKEKSVSLLEQVSDDQKLDYECMEESVASEAEELDESEKEIESPSIGLNEEECMEMSESFRHFLDEVGTKVKESFLTVYSFCEKSRNKLMGSTDDGQKVQIRTKAIKMAEFLDNMCLSLNRILDRESGDSQIGAREILLKIGFREKDIDEKELEYYRSYISKCVVQGEILQRSMKLLIQAMGET